MNKDIVGYIGSFLISIVLIPQVYTTYKARNVESLSPCFLFTSIVGASTMMYYGSSIEAVPVMISNSSVLFNSVTLLTFYFKYKKDKKGIINPPSIINDETNL